MNKFSFPQHIVATIGPVVSEEKSIELLTDDDDDGACLHLNLPRSLPFRRA